MNRWATFGFFVCCLACGTESGILSSTLADAGPAGDDSQVQPAFADVTDEQIEQFCFKTISQVTDLDWLGEQIGIQGEFVPKAWCHGLVAQSLADVQMDAVSICEMRITDCLNTSTTVFSIQQMTLNECADRIRAGREAQCMNSISDFKSCLEDSYPQGFTLGLTREALQTLADASCVDLLTEPPPMGSETPVPPSCIALERACGAVAND